MPWPDQLCRKFSTSGLDWRSGTEFFIKESPRKRRLKPTTNSLMSRHFPFLDMLMMKPRAISGTANMDTSALKPKRAMIQAVKVVPMLAPIMTLMACLRVRRPALTKPTTMTVVALDDWIIAVTPSPVTTPLSGLEVIEARNFRRPEPAAFCNPELIRFIP